MYTIGLIPSLIFSLYIAFVATREEAKNDSQKNNEKIKITYYAKRFIKVFIVMAVIDVIYTLFKTMIK